MGGSKKKKRQRKAKTGLIPHTRQQREEWVRNMKIKMLKEFKLTDEYYPIKKLYREMAAWVEDGVNRSSKIPFPEADRMIYYIFGKWVDTKGVPINTLHLLKHPYDEEQKYKLLSIQAQEEEDDRQAAELEAQERQDKEREEHEKTVQDIERILQENQDDQI